jgi:hypothetical protein
MSARVFVPAPIRKSTIVNAPRDRAFDLFTGRMTEWWFPGKGIGQNPFKEITLEPRRGGRWFERAEDGARRTGARFFFGTGLPGYFSPGVSMRTGNSIRAWRPFSRSLSRRSALA